MKLSSLSPIKFFQIDNKKAGFPPGTLTSNHEEETKETSISLISFSQDYYKEETIPSLPSNFEKNTGICNWFNVSGLRNVERIEQFGEVFELSHLLLEDVLHTRQRPKYELYDDAIFIVVKMFALDSEKEIIVEQVSIVVKENFIITFQEKEEDVFDPVRKRIEKAGKRIRSNGADYLAYALLDAIVDNYFIVLEELGERIELLEKELLLDPIPETLNKINKLKQNSMLLRRSLWPLRDVVSRFEREELSLVKKVTRPYIRDIYDHVIQATEAIESYRDVLSGMVDLYLSSVSNKMNGIMKVLTIIATIFIPLTFIAGVYGMNFQNMPELSWRYGYLGVWGIMIVLVIIMIGYFRKKNWF
ncbi:MAG: magnesium/cobalt transporter CorA [Patescibacteria group bacterium]